MNLKLKQGIEHCDDGTFQAHIKDENAKTESGNWYWFGAFVYAKEGAVEELDNAIQLVQHVCEMAGITVEFEPLTGEVKV